MEEPEKKQIIEPAAIRLARASLILHVILLFFVKWIGYITTMVWTHNYIFHLIACLILYHQLASRKPAHYYFATIYPAMASISYWHSFEAMYGDMKILPIYLYSHWAMLLSLAAVTVLILNHKSFYNEKSAPDQGG